MQKRTIIIGLVIIGLALIPSTIFAHDESTVIQYGSFLAGFTHPVLGLDHLLAMLAVGIVSAQIGGRAIWTIPATFVGVMALGGVLGLIDIGLTAIEFGIALSVLVLGVAIAAERSLPVVVALIAVALFAIFHGYAHGAEMPSLAEPFLYAFGFLTGTAIIHVIGVLIGDIPKHYKVGPTVLRVLGGGIAVVGVLFLVGVL
ncbi:MAG: HupE/UreJ family protein [Chloroflexota bacterium]